MVMVTCEYERLRNGFLSIIVISRIISMMVAMLMVLVVMMVMVFVTCE